MPSERAPGWYWVKEWPDGGGEWTLAFWGGAAWRDLDSDSEGWEVDEVYAEIGQRIPDHE